MSDTATPSLEQQLADLPGDEPAPQPIEIDIESGEGTEVVAEPQSQPPAAAPPPVKKPPRAANRISTLAAERDAAQQMASRLAQELEQARREAAAAKNDTQIATAAGMENYAQRVKTEAEAAEAELRQALTSGDADAIAKANRKVAKVAAAEADVDAWRAAQPTAEQQRQQQAQPQAQPQQQPPAQEQEAPTPPEVTEFLLENDWFDPFKRGSDGRFLRDQSGNKIQNPGYDANMHNAAMLMHNRIQWEKEKGMWNGELASPEYFQRIREGMEAQFPEYFAGGTDAGDEPPPIPTRKTPPMSQARQPVAPAQRSALPGQNGGKPNGSKVTLTGEERSFADSLRANGALRYPGGHPKAGKVMEPMDAYKEYARQKTLQPQQTQQ